MAEEHHLGMLRLTGKAASNGYGFSHCGVAVQVVLAGLSNLATGTELWPVKFFQHDRNVRLMQHGRICSAKTFAQLRQGYFLRIHLLLQSLQRDEAVGLYSDRLVELRGKGEADVDHIVCA